MPDAYAHIAALRIFATAAQLEGYYAQDYAPGDKAVTPGLSRGGYRSNVDVAVLQPQRPMLCLSGIRIVRIGGSNGPGTGTLTAVTADSLTWTPPGETTAGETVSILNGETRVLPWSDGSNYTKWVEVSRANATPMAGYEYVKLLDIIGNPIAGPLHDTEYTPAANSNTYDGPVIWNDTDYTVTNLTITPADAFVDVAAETLQQPADTRHASWVQEIATHTDAPTGRTWSWTPCSLAPHTGIGLWVRKNWTTTTPYADEASVGTLAAATVSFSCNGEDNLRADIRGLAQRALPTLVGYELYVGDNTTPDYTAAPADSGAAVTDLSFDTTGYAGHTLKWAVLSVDKFNQRCAQPNTYDGHESNAGTFYTDVWNNSHGPAPAAPSGVLVTDLEGLLTVYARYDSTFDPDGAANHWVLKYTTDGTEPATSATAVTVESAMTSDYLSWSSDAALVDETPCKVLVRTRRIDDEGEENEYTVDSINTTSTSYTVDYPAGDLRVPLFSQAETGLYVLRGETKPGGYTTHNTATTLVTSGADIVRIVPSEGGVSLDAIVQGPLEQIIAWSMRTDLWLLGLNVEQNFLPSVSASWDITISGDTKFIANAGANADIPIIVLVADGAVVNPAFEADSKKIAYTGTVGDGQTLMIDCGAETVYLDGIDVTASASGSYPLIAAGGATVEYTDHTSSSHTAAVTIYSADTETDDVPTKLGTWDASNKQIYFCVKRQKRMRVDFETMTLTVRNVERGGVHNTRFPQGPIHVCYEHLLFNVYEGSTGRWITMMSLDSTGTLHVDPDMQFATEAEMRV